MLYKGEGGERKIIRRIFNDIEGLFRMCDNEFIVDFIDFFMGFFLVMCSFLEVCREDGLFYLGVRDLRKK